MLNWKRLRKSVLDVIGPVKGWRVWVLRIVAGLLVVGGAKVAPFFTQDSLLPPGVFGKVVWGLAIIVALILGIVAAYRLRSQMEEGPSDARKARDAVRKEAWSALAKVIENLFAMCTPDYDEDRVLANKEKLEESVRKLGEAGSRTHFKEAVGYGLLCNELRAGLSTAGTEEMYCACKAHLFRVLKFSKSNEGLFEKLDPDEIEVLDSRLSRLIEEAIPEI